MQNLKYKKAEKYFIKHKQFLGDSNNLAKEVDYCLAVIHRRAGINDIPNSIIASCFNQQACLYDSAIDNTDQSQRDLVSNIVEYVKDAHGKFNILDIGSGFGEVGMLLREYDIVNFLCGVDISEKMTQIAADRAMKDAESKIYNKVICKDIANFNEASGKIGSMKYDIIILSDFITYQSNINNMLLKRLSDLAAQKCLICITFRDIKQLHQYKEGEQVLFHHDTERFYYSDLYIQNLFCDGGFSLLTSQNAQFASNESGFIMQFINYEDVYSKKI
ncbi:MAG: methyltransferase domain-containing protein [Proteobacteria bacterium]|nr:methyltransferase domain-containing protein [Pseudomonadota bacterium]